MAGIRFRRSRMMKSWTTNSKAGQSNPPPVQSPAAAFRQYQYIRSCLHPAHIWVTNDPFNKVKASTPSNEPEALERIATVYGTGDRDGYMDVSATEVTLTSDYRLSVQSVGRKCP